MCYLLSCINKAARLCTKALDSVLSSGQPSQTKGVDISHTRKYIEPSIHSRLNDIPDTSHQHTTFHTIRSTKREIDSVFRGTLGERSVPLFFGGTMKN